ncbi:hypothetical protein PENTCL1PPCAC_18025, partial [Pristionchus entomophagus]
VMVYQMDPGQAKLAEKLMILNDRAKGMLTRVYNIKKACSEQKSKPSFLSDKSLESAIKHIVKKFPIVDTRSNMSTFNHANAIKDDIIKNLSLYYYTFADLLDLKDHIMQLLTLMDACQCQLDITINHELTASYLNLVATLVSLMWLLSRVEDRKAVLGLFNAAYDLNHGQSEPSFPRLGQMIIDYDNPFKKLQEDLGPLNRLMMSALQSLASVYTRRNVTGDMWRKHQILSLTSSPSQMMYAAQTETITCEYLSLDVMDRWIILCTLVCPCHMLGDATVSTLWGQSLHMGLSLRIFRDEVMMIHPTAQSILDNMKGLSKRAAELKEMAAIAMNDCVSIHADRRRFLRSSLREMTTILKEQPGLLGPKILFVWMALSFARDEIIWLLRHLESWPQSSKKNALKVEDLMDRQLPELIHYLLELRDLVMKYSSVVHNYHLQYVNGYDCHVLSELMSSLSGQMGDTEGIIMTDLLRDLSSICAETDLAAMRLDWFRLQASWSMSNSCFSLTSNRKLTVAMNAAMFHLKMIDNLEETIRETSDLSIYCFYSRQMEIQWKTCIEMPIQCRFSLSFARLCSHFRDSLHDLCPEEKNHIIEKSLALCNSVLDEMARATITVVDRLAEYELRLAEQTTPSHVASNIAHQMARVKLDESGGKKKGGAVNEMRMAGEESVRVDRVNMTLPDKLQNNLIELCGGLSLVSSLMVSDHIFCPREYLSQQLESLLFDLISRAITPSPSLLPGGSSPSSPPTPRRPSQLLLIIHAYIAVFQNIDSAMTIDMTRIFNRTLLQQTQPQDVRGRETITSIYTKWYLEVMLRRASNGLILYSEHMRQMISATQALTPEVPFLPEQYTDPHELRALVLLIGPYGVKFLSERLAWHVASQIGELNKVVLENRDVLHRARTQFDHPEEMREVYEILCKPPKDQKNGTSAADAIMQRMVIIGEIFSFRDSVSAALKDVLDKRLPYLTATFRNLKESLPKEALPSLSEMASSLGERVSLDSALVSAVRTQSVQMQADEHYLASCLLMIGVAVCLPRLTVAPLSCYRPLVRVSLNNCHCLPSALVTVSSALFFYHGKGDSHLRMREFLAIASSSILRMCKEDSSREEAILPPILPIILDQIVNRSPFVSHDELSTCFPYDLVLTSYRSSYQHELGTA